MELMRINRFISLLLICPIVAAVSCMKTEVFEDSGFEEGINVRKTLEFSVRHAPVITRSAQLSEYEYKVNNLYIFIFKPDGSVHFKQYYTQDGGGLNVKNEQAASYGNVVLTTETLANAKIVGIANLFEKDKTGTAYYLTKSDLDKISTLEELQATVMYMGTSPSVYRGGLFMMTGYARDSKGSEIVDITPDGRLDFSIQLERTDAKVQFNITAEKPAGKNWKDFNFKLRDWKICRVPAQSLLLPKDKAAMNITQDADGAGMKYFDTPAYTAETEHSSEQGGGGGFIFYMPENRKGYRAEITEAAFPADTLRYAMREERDKIKLDTPDIAHPGKQHNDGEFTYANANSTYVEFTGTLSYIDSKNIPVNAAVTCTVHLGHDAGDANNYQTYRNTHYTYNVKIRGIGNILVEVNSGANPAGGEVENRPGYDGNLIYANTKIFELDSHYDRALVPIPRSYIGENMTWGVNTPFSSGVYSPKEKIDKGLKDYQWIKFAINKDYGYDKNRYGKRMVKFPGNLNYDDPDYDDVTLNPEFGDNRPSPSYPNHPDARLLDIHQLINRLKKEVQNPSSVIFEKDDNGNDVVYVTVFVDEYLYQQNPITGEFDTEYRTLWKESVEKEDRQLHLIAEGSSYSPDGKSSIVNSIYTFKQKSIRTIYDVNDPSLETAWGLESVMETDRLDPLPSGGLNYSTSKSNGRENMLKWTSGRNLRWSDVLNTEGPYKLNPGYDNAAYACMLRNRDLNGDNKIDSDEVRWYLASINQLQDIYLGENALDAESRLYPSNPTGNSVYWHYTTSSLENQNVPWVLWAEEGASIGSYSGSVSLNGPKYAYRCVRNLGISLENQNEVPSDFVKVSCPDLNGKYTFDLGTMNVKSTRGYYSIDPLPTDSEHSQNSLPYEKFETIKGAYPKPVVNSSDVWNRQGWSYYQTTNPCPSGYRVPNLRELMIMSSRLPDTAWETFESSYIIDHWWPTPDETVTRYIKPMYISSTSFSMDGKAPYNNERDGFVYDSVSGNIILRNGGNEDGYVRCVRDLQ